MRALHAHHAAWLSDRCSCREKKQCGRLSDRTLRSPALMLRMYQPAGLMEDCLNRFAGQCNRSGTHSLATVCRGWGRQAASDCGGGRRVSVINFCFEHDAKPRTGCRERGVDLSDPRSTVELAPISTLSPIITRPIWGILEYPWSSWRTRTRLCHSAHQHRRWRELARPPTRHNNPRR